MAPANPAQADSTDIEDRPDHAKKGPSTLSAHLTAILNDTKQNLPGGLISAKAMRSFRILVPAVADAAGRVA